MTATLVCVGVFGQGKLLFQVDTTQLIYFTTSTWGLHLANAYRVVGGYPLAGSSLYTGAGGTIASLAGAPSFTAALFAGATAGSLSEVAIATLADVNLAGQLNPVNVTLAGLPAGTPAFFQIQVLDSRATSAWNAWHTWGPFDPYISLYAGESPVFQATPQASVYSPIYQAGSPVNSTLPQGTVVPKDFVGFPGYYGLIEIIAYEPEPGTFALFAWGLALLMICRRKR
jgi:hypothetical protein